MTIPVFNKLVIYTVGAICLSGCLMFRGQQKVAKAQRKGGYDAIIIPGVPYEDASVSTLLRMRVLWAAWLYQQGLARHIIFSGAAVYTPYVEAEVMAAMGRKAGIPEEKIFLETQAEHSTENLVLGYRLAQSYGFSKVALASDPVQTWMLYELSDNFGVFDVDFLPLVPARIRPGFDTLNLDIRPAPVSPARFVPLPQRKTFWERLRGTMGKEIPQKTAISKLATSSTLRPFDF